MVTRNKSLECTRERENAKLLLRQPRRSAHPLDLAGMRISLVILAVFAARAGAADFRAVDLGASCASVEKFEESVGSRQLPWQGAEGLEGYSNLGRAFDRVVTINYFCLEGHLEAGHYLFPIEELETAVESFRQLHEQLVNSCGVPFVDNTPWQGEGSPKDPRSVQSDPREYLTSWRMGSAWVSVSLMRNFTTEQPGWRVIVMYRELEDGARSNTSLERTRWGIKCQAQTAARVAQFNR